MANNQVWIDATTGTGMVQFVTASEKSDLETANANDGISTINEPGTYSFLGENSTLGHVARNVSINSSLRIDLDTPQQAYNVQRHELSQNERNQSFHLKIAAYLSVNVVNPGVTHY